MNIYLVLKAFIFTHTSYCLLLLPASVVRLFYRVLLTCINVFLSVFQPFVVINYLISGNEISSFLRLTVGCKNTIAIIEVSSVLHPFFCFLTSLHYLGL
jgi:hypothetical protein